MASTNRETVKILCKVLIGRLEQKKLISYPAPKRQGVIESLEQKVGPFILTEEDLRNRTLETMGINADKLVGSDFAENDQFRAARAVVRKTFGDDELKGLFYQKNIREISHLVIEFILNSPLVDDVYETDEALERFIVELIKGFRPEDMH